MRASLRASPDTEHGQQARADWSPEAPETAGRPLEPEPVEDGQFAGQTAAGDDQQPLLPQNGHSAPLDGDIAPHDHEPSAAVSKFEIQSLVDEASVIRRCNWRLLPLFFAIGMLCSMDRANLAFAALEVKHDLRFSDAVYGLGSGIFFVGYALFAVPSTFVCAAIGAPRFLGGTLIAWGAVAAAFAGMTAAWQFYCLRFLLGLAESGAYPGMWFHLALFYTEREMVFAYTAVSAASALSGVAGAPMAAGLLALDGALGLRGWQWLFMLEGVPAALLGLLVLWVLPRGPGDAAFLAPEERYWLLHRKQAAAEAEDAPKGPAAAADEEGGPEQQQKGGGDGAGGWAALGQMLRERRIWWLAAVWSIVSVGMDGLVFWIPLLIKAMMYGEELAVGAERSRQELSGHAVHSAFLAGAPFTAAAAGMLLIAHSAKRLGERHWHCAAPLALAAAAAVVMALVAAAAKWVAFAALCVAAIGIWGPHGPLLSWPAALLEGTAAASGFALVKMCGAFAAALGNAAMGELHEATGSFELPMLLLAALLALGAALVLSFDKSGRKGRVDVRPLISRLQGRMGMKRSRSDPAAFYPRRTFSGSLSTIREHVARPHGHARPAAGTQQQQQQQPPRFEMPDFGYGAGPDGRQTAAAAAAAAERRAIEQSLAW